MCSKYNMFSELPKGLQYRIRRIAEPNEEAWVNQKIPALNDKTFLEAINDTDGYQKVCEYLNKVEGFLL